MKDSWTNWILQYSTGLEGCCRPAALCAIQRPRLALTAVGAYVLAAVAICLPTCDGASASPTPRGSRPDAATPNLMLGPPLDTLTLHGLPSAPMPVATPDRPTFAGPLALVRAGCSIPVSRPPLSTSGTRLVLLIPHCSPRPSQKPLHASLALCYWLPGTHGPVAPQRHVECALNRLVNCNAAATDRSSGITGREHLPHHAASTIFKAIRRSQIAPRMLRSLLRNTSPFA